MVRLNNPLAPRTNRLHAKSGEVKTWVRARLDLGDDVTLTVAELACRDEGCPDVETVIGILAQGQPIRTLRIHLPLAELSRDDIAAAIADQIAP